MKEVTRQAILDSIILEKASLYYSGLITKKEFNNIYIKIKDYANESRHSTEPGKNS